MQTAAAVHFSQWSSKHDNLMRCVCVSCVAALPVCHYGRCWEGDADEGIRQDDDWHDRALCHSGTLPLLLGPLSLHQHLLWWVNPTWRVSLYRPEQEGKHTLSDFDFLKDGSLQTHSWRLKVSQDVSERNVLKIIYQKSCALPRAVPQICWSHAELSSSLLWRFNRERLEAEQTPLTSLFRLEVTVCMCVWLDCCLGLYKPCSGGDQPQLFTQQNIITYMSCRRWWSCRLSCSSAVLSKLTAAADFLVFHLYVRKLLGSCDKQMATN